MNRLFLIAAALTAVFLISCRAPQEVVVEVTKEVVVQETRVEVEHVTATPAAAAPDAIAPEATETLPPMQATMQALVAMAGTPSFDNNGSDEEETAVIAPDDYPAILDQACAIVQENYVRDNFNGTDWPATCETYRARVADVDSQEAFWELMSDLLGELNDNHSRFVSPEQFAREFDLPSEGGGVGWIGAYFNRAREEERLTLWNVCRNGSAANAGLRRGDLILEVNGEPVNRESVSDIYALYAEESGATFTVQQGADAEPREVDLRFGGGSGCDNWGYGMLSEEPRIGYIRILDFGGDSDTNIMTFIEEMEADAPLDGLVLDVRHNPGGNSDRDIAIFTSGVFGQVGPLRAGATQTVYRIRGPVKWNETTPVALLTDGATHSAGEYFSTAMQQSGRAVIVGMPTAGNTEGITGFNLADGSIIRLAFMTLQLPDGSTMEETGVIPDIMVPLGEWGLRQQPDVQLQAAYDELLSRIGE